MAIVGGQVVIILDVGRLPGLVQGLSQSADLPEPAGLASAAQPR